MQDLKERPRHRARALRLAAVFILAAVLALAASACQLAYRFPHACDGHGGINYTLKGYYICNDGHWVGSGWLLLHPDSPQAQP